MRLPSKKTIHSGFTLMELMATMAILSIILSMALQVTDSARISVRVSEAKSLNDAVARRVFDQMKKDFSQMIVREDARIEFDARNGDDEFSFLIHSRGLTDSGVGERMASLVTYELTSDATRGLELKRGTRGYNFAGGSSDLLNLNPTNSFDPVPVTNQQVLSKNIIRIEAEYLVQGASGITRATTPPATSNTLKGVVVTVATLDDRGLRVVGANRLRTLASQFQDAAGGNADTLKNWTTVRNDIARSGVNGLPKETLQSIRCYQRTFLIP